MEANMNDLIEQYTKKKREGADYSEIRKELKKENHDDETIRFIIRKIDHQIINEELNRLKSKKTNELHIIGLVLMIGGGFLTVATYFEIINLKGYYITAYGPIIAGYFMILASRRKKDHSKKMYDRRG